MVMFVMLGLMVLIMLVVLMLMLVGSGIGYRLLWKYVLVKFRLIVLCCRCIWLVFGLLMLIVF